MIDAKEVPMKEAPMYDGETGIPQAGAAESGPAPVICAPPLRLAGADDDEDTIVRGID
ncbi:MULTISPECIES: hypothetical protein [unclassified Streptomyces]|uniref:hypothetical protein n=1 Tax=Streptomyces sp. ZSW22 TaxID=3055050 RepID=UPI0015CCD426|nr:MULTISPECIES: hypothetical protein [unclassified Streptomyces]MDN3249607.1 hypothetical protein [Streptomyces sp. ZSW22]